MTGVFMAVGFSLLVTAIWWVAINDRRIDQLSQQFNRLQQDVARDEQLSAAVKAELDTLSATIEELKSHPAAEDLSPLLDRLEASQQAIQAAVDQAQTPAGGGTPPGGSPTSGATPTTP